MLLNISIKLYEKTSLEELKTVILIKPTPQPEILDTPVNVNFQFECILIFSLIIFLIGLSRTLLNKSNFLSTLFAIEIMLLGCTLTFAFTAKMLSYPEGYIYAVTVLVLAAAESVVGLGLLITIYRLEDRDITIKSFKKLRG
jgi:NADH-quinone oxidoreductase subunit K